MATDRETQAMRRALELAARGERTTNPNPCVGAVVLDSAGEVAGEGWHERAGGPHAEVVALQAAGARARGGTVVVTLEPCDHTGRTGPCSRALLDAGLVRVVYAVDDPTPEASGGAATLRSAGLSVESGLLTEEAERGNERWLTAQRLGRPYVVWKYAATLDGRVGAADGTSRWISGPESRADTHALRSAVDTIVVGVGTILVDDPHLTVRDAEGRLAAEQPLRVVVDTDGRTPASARVRDDAASTWLATGDEVGRDERDQVDLAALLAQLWRRGRRYVLLEGGPRLAGAFLRADLVDRVVSYHAPLLLGGGPAALAGTGIATLGEAVRLDVDDVTRLGADVRISGRPVRKEA